MEKADRQALNIFTWGNPSRGDDAIGPALHHIIEQYIENFSLTHIQLIEDFQLQPEHVYDINKDACIVFVDASYEGDTGYQITPVTAAKQIGYTTHALTPNALMALYTQTQNKQCPPAFLLSVRGHNFALGAPLTKAAEANIESTAQFLKELLSCQNPLQLLQQAADSRETHSYA